MYKFVIIVIIILEIIEEFLKLKLGAKKFVAAIPILSAFQITQESKLWVSMLTSVSAF